MTSVIQLPPPPAENIGIQEKINSQEIQPNINYTGQEESKEQQEESKEQTEQQQPVNQTITLRDLLYYNFFSKFGLDFDEEHLQNYHKAINTPEIYNEIQQDIQKLANIVTPSIQATTDQIAHAWSESLHDVQQNGLKTAVGAIPVVGQVIDEFDNINKTVNSGLQGINSITTIASDELQKIESKFNKLNPANQLAEKVGALQDVIQEKAGQVLTPLVEAQDAVNTQINKAQQKIGESLIRPMVQQTGGAKILSRIQKSVKEFVGHSQSKKGKTSKKNINKKTNKIPHVIKNKTKNKKTNKILSRIKQSISEFSNL